MKLPQVKTEGTVAVEQAINQRRTVRSYKPTMLSLDQLAQLLWSAQGITENKGSKRAAPSAGALYPMDIYVVAGQGCVAQIEAGHIGQNLFLQAEALGLKAGIVGAFHDTKLNKILDLPRAHEPLLIMPVGYSAEE